MGELNNFHINDDGSVTVGQQLSEQEKNILDIFKIEKSKGGVFSSRRMKKRALKYANLVNYPEFKVDKLMLDSYPDDFANYPKTTSLIVWISIAIIFLCGGITFAFPSYFEFKYVCYYNEEYNKHLNALEKYRRTGDLEKYCQETNRAYYEGCHITQEELDRHIIAYENTRNWYIEEMLKYLILMLCCLSISFITYKKSQRLAKQINPNNKPKQS